ncbi:MAG: hypothetical protein IJB85_02265 [Clostridia bacterium]|nr:hypothetical protein [Clostridia bacterium]
MRDDRLNAYMKTHALPLEPDAGYEQRIKATLSSLPARSVRKKNRMSGSRLVLAAVLAVAMVLFIAPGSEVMLTTQYLQAYSSEDEQQYIVKGIYKEADVMGKADADADGWVHIQDHAELMTFLGMSPRIPQTVGGCWQLSDMVGKYMDYGLYLGLKYTCPDKPGEKLSFTIESEPHMRERIEHHALQMEKGTQTKVEINGQTAYVEREMWNEIHPDANEYRISWEEDQCSFDVGGISSLEELTQIAGQMMEMYRAWTPAVKQRWLPTGRSDYDMDSRSFTTYEEMDAFFGGKVPIPAEQYGEWRIRDYAGNKWMLDSWQYDVHAWYRHPDRPQADLIVSTYSYQDFKNVNMSFEQSYEGRVIRHKGLDIYVTHNADRLVCICMKAHSLYYVSGDIGLDTAKSILEELVP